MALRLKKSSLTSKVMAIAGLLAAIVLGVTPALTAQAYSNLQVPFSSTGGSSGFPNLAQVTAVGAVTADTITVGGCIGCGPIGTFANVNNTLVTGDIVIGMNTSTIASLTGLRAVTSTLNIWTPDNYTVNATNTLTLNATTTNLMATSGTIQSLFFNNGTSQGSLTVNGSTSTFAGVSSTVISTDNIMFQGNTNTSLNNAGATLILTVNSAAYQFDSASFYQGGGGRALGRYGNTWGAIYSSSSIVGSSVSSTGVTTSTFFGPVSTTKLVVTNAPAATTGRSPLCVEADGEVSVGTAGVCPVSALDAKSKVSTISYGLKDILTTDFYDWRFKQDDGRIHNGPIADYLIRNMPNLVIYKDGKVVGYDYVSMIGVLGQALKEEHSEMKKLEARLDALEEKEKDKVKENSCHL